ncbi:aminopeptidase N [Actinomadura rudentiformis]|uniref:Aminopeptidase N n=1 Tax=Actinomadura rudentiformis TaxID=359158 RepID=A0A6H9YLY7_9ACTN|nr:aminopeptidase N [Actinomadura rudentiformis]KAB2346810.1 aminopeptidase N [Actinomadura rudentiformis]
MTSAAALTRAEARERARLLDVHSYSVKLDLTRGDEVFGCSTVIWFAAAERGATSFAEIRPGAVRRIELNGRPLDPMTAVRGGRLVLPALGEENELLVEADMLYTRTGEGMHRFVDTEDGEVYVYANCGPDHAPSVFPCFDQPDLKAAFSVAVTAPVTWSVRSNGTEQSRRTRGTGQYWEFAPTEPISTSLVTMAGGPFHSVEATHDGIALGLHCRRSLARHLDPDTEELLDLTRRSFDRFHEVFEQRYAFGKYDQVFVPEMNWGAIEKPGCVLFNERFVFQAAVTDTQRELRATVIAHEMAHMWFGNLVTMRWWDDVWLSESFAEYMGYEIAAAASRFASPWTAFSISRKSWGYDADQRPTTHPVAAESLEDVASALMNFDGISYAKGASALRQLVAWVGEETFFQGVNDYFAAHRFGNADLTDLLDAIGAAAPGRDVRDWAHRWLRTTGVDTLRAEVEGESVVVSHVGALRPHRLLVSLYDDVPERGLVLRERVAADIVPGTSRTVIPDVLQPAQPGAPIRAQSDASWSAPLGPPQGSVEPSAPGSGQVDASGSALSEASVSAELDAPGSGQADAPGAVRSGAPGSARVDASGSALSDAACSAQADGPGAVLSDASRSARPGASAESVRADASTKVGAPGTVRVGRSGAVRSRGLVLLNDGDLTYAKVRLDEESWEAVKSGLSTIDDSLTRALLWNTARDMVRDGDLPAEEYLSLVAAQLPSENVVAIAEAVLTFTRVHVADRFMRPECRPAALATLSEVCRTILSDRGSAGDLRLAAVRTLIPSSQTADELTDLRRWLHVGSLAGGPDLDTELRWQILHQLSALGEAGEREIAAELERDPGSVGEEGAARCRAALPDPGAKRHAWGLLFTGNVLSPRLLAAVARGFWQPARPEPTAGYLERYFDEIPAVAERGQMVAMTLGRELFPAHAATPDTVRAAARCLERDALAVALRRALADQLDDLQRALRLRRLAEGNRLA